MNDDREDRFAPWLPRVLFDRAELLHMVASLAGHLAFLVAAALAVPALAVEEEDDVGPGDLRYMLAAATPAADPPEDQEPEPPPEVTTDPGADGHVRTMSRCGGLHGGTMGEPSAPNVSRRYGVQGPADNPDPHLARERSSTATWPELVSFWPLDAHWPGDPEAPTVVWGRDDALGNDPSSHRGHPWADDLGVAFGSPGIGIGLWTLCPTCGAEGRGARLDLPTAPGGATGTERASRLARW